MKFLICTLAIVALALAEEDVERQLVKGNNEFTAKLFNEVAKKEKGKSVVMSGFSAMSPLAQLGLGSVGANHDEILKAIGMPDDETVKGAFAALNSNLRKTKGIELKVANRVYIPEGGALNDTFAAMSRVVFSSDVKNVDFSKNVETVNAINEWVEENTNNRIKDLLSSDSVDESTRAVLVNAIYFKGNWEEQFDKKATEDRDFHVSKDKTIKVPTMYKNGNFRYGYNDELNAQLLELFYKGGESSFLIVLPNEVDGIDELQQKLLVPSTLDKAVEQMYETEVDLYLPKFKIETTINLKEALQNIGVQKLFQPGEARLDYIIKGEGDLYVSDAIQKAFIEVNEEGAEAAAASAFTVVGYSLVIKPPKKMFDANHPFIFLLKQNSNILFEGAYRS